MTSTPQLLDPARLSALGRLLRGTPSDRRTLALETAHSITEIFRPRTTLLVWDERDEIWTHIVSLKNGELSMTREPVSPYDPVVHADLAWSVFHARELDSSSPAASYRASTAVREWSGAALNAKLVADYRVRSALSFPLPGATFEGRVICIDPEAYVEDDLAAGEIVALAVVSRMDHFHLLERAHEAASAEQRVRLARDLHDGSLQSLTAVALQLEAIQRIITADPADAAARLADVQRLIEIDQREMRLLIEQLRPDSAKETTTRLKTRLSELAERFRAQWSLDVDIEVEAIRRPVSSAIAHEIYSLVTEAIANAAKHSRATHLFARVLAGETAVMIEVRDDGQGFPFRGRYDLAELNRLRRGPVTLKERIASLGGELVVDSSDRGSHLVMTIPAHAERKLG